MCLSDKITGLAKKQLNRIKARIKTLNNTFMFKKLFILAVAAVAALSASAELPSVTLKDINGKTINTAELSNDGKPMVISFFALWCKPCQRELKAINEVYADWQDETGVKLVR